MARYASLRLLGIVGIASAQDLFLKSRGSTTQTVNPNETDATLQLAVASGNSWWKTLTPAENHMLCIDLPGGDAKNGNMLWLWECNGQDSQIWVFDSYQIRYGLDESFCIDAREMANGEQLMLWDCNGLPQQTWGWDDAESKAYILNTGTCLDWWEGDTDLGQPLHVWDCNGLSNQEWGLWDSDQPSGGGGDVPSNVFMPSCANAATGGSWPTFKSQAELQANAEWSSYFTKVYGEVPSIGYPICVGAFTQIPKSGGLSTTVTQCRAQSLGAAGSGMLVDRMSDCCDPPSGVTFIYNERNTKLAVRDNMWFEAQHVKKGGDKDSSWYYLVFGSAVWINVGKTKVFQDHPDASAFFKISGGCHDRNHHSTTPTECENDFSAWFAKARSGGLNSLQFTHHYDCGCGENGVSSWDGHSKLCNTEIIDLAGDGKKACSGSMKAGWAAQQTCTCNEAKPHFNCQGFGVQ